MSGLLGGCVVGWWVFGWLLLFAWWIVFVLLHLADALGGLCLVVAVWW